ncbi:hypothetical protein MPSI1_003323 [Malassezia psittaci]|uniref:GRIP-related Arf-binding domain-containing protein n=1 Tax=Malassezia psittaci TaxID=1821823 RepID=A0AAF0JFE4_9BASI|nr:hypothetical protein MPSI1_003323 [Malassezia psittaci]
MENASNTTGADNAEKDQDLPTSDIPDTNPNSTDMQPTETIARDASEVAKLRQELEQAHTERDQFEASYNALLEKLAHMRTTVGARLTQDAEELDRREQQIERLTLQVGEIETTNTQLQEELSLSHKELERTIAELDTLRVQAANTASNDANHELHHLETRCKELQEICNTNHQEIERQARALQEERSWREDLETEAQRTEAALNAAKEREAQWQSSINQEKQVARQLQQALEELQISECFLIDLSAQEREERRMAQEMQSQVDRADSELEACKLRIHDMERELDSAREATEKYSALQVEVKEKNLLIGKLRHEAVILNEHLTEALRLVRRDASEAMVDRRLVTNLILQFLTAPRADSKRFEILRVIASVLQWDDEQQEKAGLQKQNPRAGIRFLGFGGGGGKPSSSNATTSASGDESVSNLFVEFLLSEVERSEASKSPSAPTESTSQSSFDLHRLAQLDEQPSDRTPS